MSSLSSRVAPVPPASLSASSMHSTTSSNSVVSLAMDLLHANTTVKEHSSLLQSPTRVTTTTTTIAIGGAQLVLPPLAIATTTTTTTTTVEEPVEFLPRPDVAQDDNNTTHHRRRWHDTAYTWFSKYRNAVLHALCLMVQALATIANAAVTVFGLGVGVGLIMGDSLRGGANSAAEEAPAAAAAAAAAPVYTLERPASSSCRAAVRRTGGSARTILTNESGDGLPAQ